MDNKSDHLVKCDRCRAVEGEIHPLHGFMVSLEEFETDNRILMVCQRCRIQLKVRSSQKSSKDPRSESSFKNLINKLFKNN